MPQKLTEEQLKIVREAIKNKQDIIIDDDRYGDLELLLSVRRQNRSFHFKNTDLNFNEAEVNDKTNQYEVRLDLWDVEQYIEVANVAVMNIFAVPLYAFDDELDEMIDENADSCNTITPLYNLEEINMSEIYDEYLSIKYPMAHINIAELHTFYISPEFRKIGIAEFMYRNLNSILNSEYCQVIYLMGVYVNPFKEQISLDQIDDTNELSYSYENAEDSLIDTMINSLKKNGFKQLGNDKRSFYLNMFENDDEYMGDEFY